ncbi:MBL fold metallo-hydrolase [Desulfonatronum lacustre]|uniref:MBL fold metallo-hydrolase n=1 Tax=Desulfonatronum lacustre TaxID=66849 RepID=UPI00048C4832|nr:MBL fold metallo-hydrolase [Desulfonatronum lacustre]SMP73567.1 hydroxyacylglutathione hydrolase [Desulfonatronum zhilinae]
MALIFESIQTDGIAQVSYLLGDDAEGTAAVFDPRPDVDCYLQLAREKQVSITHIFETHIHVDFVSGARELCTRAESAKIYLSHEGGARYGFEHEGVADGDVFELGSALITARHTPGHSPEHMAYLLSEKDHPEAPWGVLTGDSLFVSSAGRPDLLGRSREKELAEQLFHTLHDFYLKLDDGVIIYPTHAQGSPCGEDIGDRLRSTIGYERRFNAFLQFDNAESFIKHALAGASPIPTYYPLMKTLNTKGPMVLGNLPPVRGLPPKFFQEAAQDHNNVLIDTRMMLAFGGGHIKGALSIGGLPILSIWAGWLLDPGQPILLVLESDDTLEAIVRYFVRTGYTKFAGYLVGGMKAWNNAGLPLESVGQKTVHEVQAAGKELQILDVRAPAEWKDGHIPNARHVFLGELREHLGALDKDKPTAVYCDSGYRASIATSILQQHGFGNVCNIPGSWQAWKNAGFPVERESEKK